jgi:signal transduction histidine kinase
MSDSDKVEALVHLAGSVAHELNNIFTAVTGNLSLLEDSFSRDNENAGLVSDVMRTANRGIQLSQQLQAFAGRQRLQRARFDVNRSVAAIMAAMKRDALRHVDVQLGLHPASCIVAADEEKFQSVVEELARNAAAAMNHRGWMIVSTGPFVLEAGQVGRLPPGAYIRLCVRDSGHGMSQEVVKRALDPLFSTRGGNRGWGLARCAGFLRQSGGDILLSSVKGQGTAVEIYLPQSAA